MRGHWQKTVPTESGSYFTADRDGNLAGIKHVTYHNGKLVFAGLMIRNPDTDGWAGWWWSEPVLNPPTPPKWDEE